MSLRIGIGYDIHALGAQRPLKLGGVEIPGAPGLIGHSDADVLLHAIADAILGALALGDIGEHFPPDDPAFAGADSASLLAEVLKKARQRGFRPRQVDSTIIAERPKLSPHKHAIVANLATIMGIPVERVSVKATTHEGLGALGEGRGVAAHSVVLMESAGEESHE